MLFALPARRATRSINPRMPPASVMTPTIASMQTTKPMIIARSGSKNWSRKYGVTTSRSPSSRLETTPWPAARSTRNVPARIPAKSASRGRLKRIASATATSGGRTAVRSGGVQRSETVALSSTRSPSTTVYSRVRLPFWSRSRNEAPTPGSGWSRPGAAAARPPRRRPAADRAPASAGARGAASCRGCRRRSGAASRRARARGSRPGARARPARSGRPARGRGARPRCPRAARAESREQELVRVEREQVGLVGAREEEDRAQDGCGREHGEEAPHGTQNIGIGGRAARTERRLRQRPRSAARECYSHPAMLFARDEAGALATGVPGGCPRRSSGS